MRTILALLVVAIAILGVILAIPRQGNEGKAVFKTMSGPSEGKLLTELPDVLSESAPDFRDLVFKINLAENQKAESIGFGAGAKHNGKTIGFNLWLLGPWERWQPEGVPQTMYRGLGVIRGVGKDSDHLVAALSELYGVKEKKAKMARSTVVGIIVLEGDPNRPKQGILKTKLFFNEESDTNYAELFMNIDISKHRLVLAEKDVEYRQNIVKSLAMGSAKPQKQKL